MIVKFVVTADCVIFGSENYKNDFHAMVAEANGISDREVRGGGLADLEQRRVFGTSYGFGAYDPKAVACLLDGWTVEEPSDYS
jgi:hypothetical protein